MNATELVAAFRRREVSPREAVADAIVRLEEIAPLNAITAFASERALAEAGAAERRHRAGDDAPLLGVPFVVKDLFDTADVPTSYGSKLFAGHVPRADAAVVAATRAAGAILVAKATTHEFAWGITTTSAAFGPTLNPWDTDRIPGGSSGGSAVALATGCVPLAIGSDTGGSVRIPAAFCGVAGFKPSYGRLSLAGAMPLAPTLDHAGLMARDPADLAPWMATLTSETTPVVGLEGRRVGVLEELPGAALDPPAREALDQAAAALASLGAHVDAITLPSMLDVFAPIQAAEALAVHTGRGLFPARADEYSPDVLARLQAAQELAPQSALTASARREQLRGEVLAALGAVDLMLSPVSSCLPPRLGEEQLRRGDALVPIRQLAMSYTVLQDLLGLPACAIGVVDPGSGLPIGVQLSAAPYRDELVLSAARALAPAMKRPGVAARPGRASS